MKKFLVAFGILCFVAGFAIGTTHGKPRVYMSPEAVEYWLKAPSGETESPVRYTRIQEKYSEYYKSDVYTKTDRWDTYGGATAELTFDTMNGDVLVHIPRAD